MWAELLLFIFVFIFAIHQFYDLRKEKLKARLLKNDEFNKFKSENKKS